MKKKKDQELTWFYNYYGSGFLTILRQEISETTPLLKYSANDSSTDTCTAVFQKNDKTNQVNHPLTVVLFIRFK